MADNKTASETERKPESTDTQSAGLVKDRAAAAATTTANPVVETARTLGRAKNSKAAGTKTRPPAKAPAMAIPAFVRSLPPNTSFADATKAAAKLGLKLSQSYFYLLKSANKSQKPAPKAKAAGWSQPNAHKTSEKPAPKSKPAQAPARTGLRLVSDHSDEQSLIDAVRAIGAARARELLTSVETFERN